MVVVVVVVDKNSMITVRETWLAAAVVVVVADDDFVVDYYYSGAGVAVTAPVLVMNIDLCYYFPFDWMCDGHGCYHLREKEDFVRCSDADADADDSDVDVGDHCGGLFDEGSHHHSHSHSHYHHHRDASQRVLLVAVAFVVSPKFVLSYYQVGRCSWEEYKALVF